MKVSLINYTPNAVETLLFTKQTRLGLSAGRWEDICNMPEEEKLAEIDYIADSIPSSWEFVDYTFCIEGVSRAFTHQFVRNRTGSYAQQSLRVTDASGFDYITGPSIAGDKAMTEMYDAVMEDIKMGYQQLIEGGVPPEDARGVLPTNICTNIVAKYNLRTIADLALSRTGGRTQDEFRRVFDAMIDRILEVHPWAEKFLFKRDRDYWKELERAVAETVPGLLQRGKILKIIDRMRKDV